MFSTECQAEKRNFDIDIPLTYDFKPRILNERYLWNALKQAEEKNKILQEEKNSMIMGHEKDTRVSDNVTNIQPDTITYSKTLTDIQEDQPNKEATEKPMIQQTLLQSYAYTRKRSRSLDKSTSERDLVNEGH